MLTPTTATTKSAPTLPWPMAIMCFCHLSRNYLNQLLNVPRFFFPEEQKSDGDTERQDSHRILYISMSQGLSPRKIPFLS